MRPISLKTKISGVIILSVILLTVTVGAFYVTAGIVHLKEREERFIAESIKNASDLAYMMTHHFIHNDFSFMNNLASYYGKHAYHVYVVVVDTQNRIMARSGGMELGHTLEIPAPYKTESIDGAEVRKYIDAGKGYIGISYPIKAGDLVLGAVKMGLNADWLTEERNLLTKTIVVSLAASFIIIVLGIGLSSWIVNKTVVPILLLKQSAEAVGKGDYSQSVTIQSKDEIGILAGSFNKMIVDLKSSRAQLVEKHYVDSIIAGMHDALIILTPEGRIQTVNKTTLDLFGYKEDELLHQPAELIFGKTSVDTELVVELRKTGLKGNIEKNLLSKNGHEIPVLLSCSVMEEGGSFRGIVCIAKDIIQRKRTEEELKAAMIAVYEEKARLEAVIAAIGDSLIMLAPDFTIMYQNRIDRELVGDHVGEPCYEAFEGKDALCEGCPAEQSFRDGQVHRATRVAVTNAGTMQLDITASPLRGAAGQVIAVIETARDVTEQKNAQEALQKSHEWLETLVRERTAELMVMNEQLRNLSMHLNDVREEERTTIAREIHDELGQSLTALKMDLAWLSKRLLKNQTPILEKAGSMTELIEATIQNVKRISSALRPGILDHLGLSAAIEWQAGEFKKRTGISCDVAFEPEEIILDRNRSTIIFRIFQETLTNVARHAKASKVVVSLERRADELVFHVKDNGKGIAEKQVSDAKSLGLIGMRERVHHCGGSLTISGARNKGTTVAVRIPLNG